MRTIVYLIALLIVTVITINSVSASVDLRYFNAEKRGTDIILEWGSNAELNNLFYTIERSTNGADYSSIGNVDGSGTSTSIVDYIFTDDSPANNDNYYRLRMTDNQGVDTYSDVIFIEGISTNPGTLIITFPGAITTYNPFSIKIPRIGNPNITFHIYGLDGRLVHEETHQLGYPTTVNLDVPELNPGMYFLAADDNLTRISKRFIVTR